MVTLSPDESEPPVSAVRYAARLLWVAVQLILVLCLGQTGVLFFYQGF